MQKALPFILACVWASNLDAQNVGIGTPAPTAPLTVIANDTAKGIIQKTGIVEVGFYTSTGAAYVQTWSPTNLNFATGNGGAKLTIQHSNGFIGVNTASPSAQLDVNGTFRLRGNGAGDNKLLTSDASGNATWKGAIGFFAELSNDMNLLDNVSTPLTTFNEEFDEGGNFNPATGRFTVPEDGLYNITYNVVFEENSGDDKEVYVNVQKNNTTFKSFHYRVVGANLSGYNNNVGSVLVKFSQGDTISLAVIRKESGGSVLHGGNFSLSTSLSVFKVR